jgi:ABC-type sulfate transport system permease subunit
MKFRAPVLAGILFALTLGVDLLIYFSSHKLAAVMLVTAPCLILANVFN